MNWRQVELANGLRLVSIERPQTPIVAVKVFVRAGSRYDRDASGGAHLLEHLLFKGTRSRSAREIYAAIERFGGSIEGNTAKEYTRFHATLPSRHFKVGVSILADILSAPLLAEEDFWNEKLIVLEEIQRMRDNVNFIFNLFAQAMWPHHPLRYPVWGNEKSLSNLEWSDLIAFHAQAYVTGNAVVVLCGDIKHDVVDVVDRQFAAFPMAEAQFPPIVEEQSLTEPRLVHLEKDLFQTHLLLGFPTIGMKHQDRSALQVIERVLGMGGSSRLFQCLREEKMLVYNAHTVMASYKDLGYLAVYATCQPKNVPRVRDFLLQEFDGLGHYGVANEELVRAKSNYEGALARRFETNSAIANAFGVKALLHQIEPLAEVVARIKAVTQEDVIRVARKYFMPNQYVLTTVGRTG